MAQDDIFSSGSTLEFLKIMGTGTASDGSDASAQAAPGASSPDGDATIAMSQSHAADPEATVAVSAAQRAAMAADNSTAASPYASADSTGAFLASAGYQAQAPKPADNPVVIKGGPRRVSRADGRQPKLGMPMGRRKFEFSNGDQMFVEPPKHRLFNILAPVVVLLVLVAGGAFAYCQSQATSTHYSQEQLIGTTGYDGALSLTPAGDGGYYTAFFVTSTTTDETVIGDLSSVFLYRCDKGVTTAVRVDIPTNLYVTPYSSYSKNYYSLDKTLKETQSLTRALQSIIDELGIRIYNVVCCDQAEYDLINAYLGGSSSDTSIFDESKLLGRIRTNLSAEGLLSWCTSIRNIGTSNINEFTVPTTSLGAGDVVMQQASKSTYSTMLQKYLGNIKYDDRGNYYGTQYDEDGNPILDEKGNPQGCIYTDYDAGTLYFDENGYLVFYGQHYDAQGNPVGTQYDEDGNALLDGNGNPQGTVYDENGDPERDWLGNVVVNNG